MKKVGLYIVVSVIVTAVAVMFIMKNLSIAKGSEIKIQQLAVAEKAVLKQLHRQDSDIIKRLTAFTDAVAADKDFSLKLFVENEKSAPAVVEVASRYMKAMGFSVLKVVDSSDVIISSGHFPASAGQNVSPQISLLSSKTSLLKENIMGNQVLTLQTKKEFRIADFRFIAVGGIEIDDAFFESISPLDNVKVFMKQGTTYSGLDAIKSISEVKDNKIIINDKEFLATRIPFPSADKSSDTYLVVVLEE